MRYLIELPIHFTELSIIWVLYYLYFIAGETKGLRDLRVVQGHTGFELSQPGSCVASGCF